MCATNHSSRTLSNRLERRAAGNRRAGTQEHWARDALDCYLDGMSFAEIAYIMGVGVSATRNAVLAESLYRLMALHGCERIEDVAELNGTAH